MEGAQVRCARFSPKKFNRASKVQGSRLRHAKGVTTPWHTGLSYGCVRLEVRGDIKLKYFTTDHTELAEAVYFLRFQNKLLTGVTLRVTVFLNMI